MNEKILIGVIIAVAILILVSFSGVVGYQTTKSSTIAKASPLFTIRSSRAIDRESKDIACDYVGKGEEIIIPLPVRNNREVLLEKIKDRISKMNVEEFTRFKNLIIDELRNINALKEIDINNGMGVQYPSGLPIPFCDKLTVSNPIICLLSNLYYFLLDFIIEPILLMIIIPLFFLYLLVYALIEGGMPPTIYFPFCGWRYDY